MSDRPSLVPFPDRADATFPLRVSASHRYLETAHGRPFLLQGDTAWSLIVGCSVADAERYLDDRAAKGFTATIVNLIERCFAPDPPRTTDGIEPFDEVADFRTLRDDYLDRAATVIEAARQRGILVLLCPAYLGYRDPAYPGFEGRPEGWYDLVVSQPVTNLGEFGRRVGGALAHLDNIVWVLAGDRLPGGALPHMEAMAEGLRKASSSALFTAHVHPGRRALESFAWLELNQVYSYGIVHRRVHDEYRLEPPRPVILFESTYENEGDSTRLMIRQQSWWAMLGGACGQFFGGKPVWGAFPGWREALDTPCALDQVHLARFFGRLPWWQLAPDLDDQLLVDGLGEHHGLDRAVAAIASDGSIAVVYVPRHREIALDFTALLEGRYGARWYDPASGAWQAVGRFAAAGRWPFTPPGAEDAVLLLERLADEDAQGRTA
ncbi:MAG TPA: DUF4038 domain-containing protein [Candidatus Deferrimicrobium sp.]|nr:DUF4038 domain-containing protein [Candidatus Deferrimicrobium sp.]